MKMIEFPSNGGTTPGFLATPATPHAPGLVLIQEWWGLVSHIKDVATRAAAEGFVVLAPDLYHGEQAKSPDRAGKMLMALDIPRAAEEILAAGDYLAAQPAVEPKRVGVMGFCMGGQLALYAAQEYPQRFGAAVDFYGIHPNVKVDPARVTVPVLLHFAERDKSVPVDSARSFAARLIEGKGPVEVHYYDADHAFFNDTRPEVYNEEGAELAWQRTLAFLRHHLTD